VVAVASGEARGLAVKRDGTVWEWSGVNQDPVQVSALSGVAAVAEAFLWYGEDYSTARGIALKRDGTVWTWDEVGQSTLAPVQVSGLAGITAIAGGEVSLALKEDGTVWRWDAAADQPSPLRVSGVDGVIAIAVGEADASFSASEAHELALKTDGTVWAWGPNEFGQLGDGTTVYRAAPVQVAALSGVAAIAAAGSSSVAVTRDGAVLAWGAGADGFGARWSLPSQVPPLGSPDLAVTLSHPGAFAVGGLGVYRINVANTGLTATSGMVILTDTLPPGLAFVSATGGGWVCGSADRIVTCANPASIRPGASSVVALTVRVEPQAYPGVTNLATVSNETDFSAWNNTIGDPTVVLPGGG